MMKKLVALLIVITSIVTFFSCNTTTTPYIKHSLAKPEKVSAGCDGLSTAFAVEGSIIGERYSFERCLSSNFDGKYVLERRGDSIAVSFPKTEGPQAVYKLVMDIDTYPAYHFLTIDGTTINVVTAGN